MKNRGYLTIMAFVVLLAFLASGCYPGDAAAPDSRTAEEGAGQSEIFRIAVANNYAPFGYVDANGSPAGFDYEYARRICEEIGAECDVASLPFEGIFDMVASGEVDFAVSSFTITEERKRRVDFTVPYYYSYGQFTGKEGAEEVTPEMLNRGARVAVQKSTVYEALMKSDDFAGVTPVIVDTQEEAFMMVAEEKADYTVSDDVLAELVSTESEFFMEGSIDGVAPASGRLKEGFWKEQLGEGEIAIAVAKGNEPLVEELSDAIRRLNGAGFGRNLSKRYFNRDITLK